MFEKSHDALFKPTIFPLEKQEQTEFYLIPTLSNSQVNKF